MTPSLTHIAIHAQDFAAVVDFYQRFCEMSVCHRRSDGDSHVAWLAEPGREKEFIIVVINGGRWHDQAKDDFSHLGFAVKSREAVDAIAERARREDCLAWPPTEEAYPVGYYCGVRDPAGNFVEFSYGQPLGPGARDARP